jgi:hypothetical protein
MPTFFPAHPQPFIHTIPSFSLLLLLLLRHTRIHSFELCFQLLQVLIHKPKWLLCERSSKWEGFFINFVLNTIIMIHNNLHLKSYQYKENTAAYIEVNLCRRARRRAKILSFCMEKLFMTVFLFHKSGEKCFPFFLSLSLIYQCHSLVRDSAIKWSVCVCKWTKKAFPFDCNNTKHLSSFLIWRILNNVFCGFLRFARFSKDLFSRNSIL